MLITGGAGFVGSNLAVWFRAHYPDLHIIAADNLKRRGSELNLARLRTHDIEFTHCDIRNPEDLRFDDRHVDLIIECSAEPSVLAGYGGSPEYVVNTNLGGTINCLELARRTGAAIVFLSTSRVYPIITLNQIATNEQPTRLALNETQTIPGVSIRGISEQVPLTGARSLYGATKLASELLLEEYGAMYDLKYVVNRCGVLTGPWQMGKVDQGVFALWMATHYFGGELRYLGWGGTGKQVRDLLHIDDLARLVDHQADHLDERSGDIFNVGGGTAISLSLLETTALCEEITGRHIAISTVPETHQADLKLYITDNAAVTAATGWQPQISARDTLISLFDWLQTSESLVRHLWAK